MKYKDDRIIERLHKKTKELIMSRGVKGWNMNTLATESGIAKSTLYRIIDSKEALILEVILEDMRRLEHGVKYILMNDSSSDIIESISELVTEAVPLMFGSYLNEALMEYPELEEKVKENEDNIRESVMMFIDYGQQRGQIKENVDPVTVFQTMLGVVLQFVRLGYTGDQLTEKINQGFKYIFEGIRVSS